jgi:hypothetical protein
MTAIRRSHAGEIRPSRTSAEGATAPETLRQKDRAGDEFLERRSANERGPHRRGKPAFRRILSGPMTEGRAFDVPDALDQML